MAELKVTVVEISRRPVDPTTIYAVFDEQSAAEQFISDVNSDREYFIDNVRENEDKSKWDKYYWSSREIYYNRDFNYIKTSGIDNKLIPQ